MPKIARRFRVVPLPQGDQVAALEDSKSNLMAAVATAGEGGDRYGARSPVTANAREFDKVKKKAEADAVKVTVWALAYNEFGPLQDAHPPRDGDAGDKRAGYDRKSFPLALLKASLVEPDTAEGETDDERLADLLAKGEKAFEELGSLSYVHYSKLNDAAWEVNVGDDSLPPYSAESLVKQARERDSKPQRDSE
jgi:hypothetical protein